MAALKIPFEGQSEAQAREANQLLLTTLTDTLAKLIGEDLTTRILCSAWGIDASDTFWKEMTNE